MGVVYSHDEDDGSALIEVEFLDIGVHHSFSIANHDGYTMAALSEAALVLASEATEDSPRSALDTVLIQIFIFCKSMDYPLISVKTAKFKSLNNLFEYGVQNKRKLLDGKFFRSFRNSQ